MDQQNQQNAHEFKVFVGNLPYSITEEQLKQVFVQVGGFDEDQITDVIILKERNPQDPSRPPRSRGVGFVAFTSKEAVAQAIERVNAVEVEYEVKGELKKRPIFVHEALPYVPRDQREPQAGGGYQEPAAGSEE